MAGFIVMQGVFYSLAKLAGGELEDDSEEFDFLRVSIGNTKLDIMAGLNQPARVLLVAGLSTFEKKGIIETVKRLDLQRTASNFIKYKQSPLIALPKNLLFEENTIGEATSRSELLLQSIMPLWLRDTLEAARLNEGSMKKTASLATGIGTFLGAAAVTIPDPLLSPSARRIYKSRGIARIDPPDWPDWIKEADQSRLKESLEWTFGKTMSEWLLDNEGWLERLSQKRAKEVIRSKASRIRKKMKRQVPKQPEPKP